MFNRVIWTSIGGLVGLVFAEFMLSLRAGDTSQAGLGLLAIMGLVFPVGLIGSLIVSTLVAPTIIAWVNTLKPLRLKRLEVVLLFGFGCLALLATTKLGLAVGTFAQKAFRQVEYRLLAVTLAAIAGFVLVLLAYAPLRFLVGLLVRKVKRGSSIPAITSLHSRLATLTFLALFFHSLPSLLPLLNSVDLKILWLIWAWGFGALMFELFADKYPISMKKVLVLSLLSVGVFVSGKYAVEKTYDLADALGRHTIVSKQILKGFQKLYDGDGDGVSSGFGGRDCDDSNASITPGRLDLPGDGIDQNCSGSDFVDEGKVVKSAAASLALPNKKPHVILLTIDALRYDRVAADMPFLSSLGRESIEFSNAYSHGASTYWSIASLMTSKLPSRLNMGRDQTPVATETLLPELLQRSGWRTSLFANVTVFFVRGLSQGFRHGDKDYQTSHHTIHGERPGAAHMTAGMLAKLKAMRDEKSEKPIFLWGHYYDPHDPYFAVDGFPSDGTDDFSRYRAICRSVDDSLRQFVSGLKRLKMWDNTILIVTADHGEEFGEHGGRFHGKTLYEEMTRVPLVMRLPGIAPRQITEPIGQMDIAPTVLGLLDQPRFLEYRGRDLSQPLVSGQPIPQEPVFFEVLPDSNYSGHILGARIGRFKVLYAPKSHYFEVYDLVEDPKERINLASTKLDLKRRLLDEVDAHLYHLALGKSGAEKPQGTPRGFPRHLKTK